MKGKTYCVYKHTSPCGKSYIGITSQRPSNRFRNGDGYKHNKYFYRAIQKYGWGNFTHQILINGLSESDALIEEERLIRELGTCNSDLGFNLMTAGGSAGTHSQETKEKIRVAATGRRASEETRAKMSLSKNGHELSEISRNKLRQKRIGEKNPFWGRKHTEESKQKIKTNSADFSGEKSVNARRVSQYRTSGEFIKTYGSISGAAKENNIQSPYNISACCNGRQRTACGYVWKYSDKGIEVIR